MDYTIAAIATAPGEAGIGIVRMSGKDSIDLLKKIFKPNRNINIIDIPSRTVTYGHIIDGNNEVVDEVLIIIMKAPYSYTTEDVVEIHCHGGVIPVKRVLEIVLRNGAILAEQGEFTKRAFINGRIDLAQAEAVIDVITAKTETGLNAALNQLEGDLSKEIRKIMNDVLSIIASIEASIDFPEHDIEELTSSNILKMSKNIECSLKLLIDSFDEGRIIRDGLNTAIVGRPNVGKSSLLNLLLKDNRAIVTDIPGTTRDVIEEYLNIGGILIKLIDTAGLRETNDEVERIGVQRTRKAIDEAELIILVIDSSEQLTIEDKQIIDNLVDKKVIVVANKIDLGIKISFDFIFDKIETDNIINMSVKNTEGIDVLENRIKNIVFNGDVSITKNKMITSIRHKDLLEKAYENLEIAMNSINEGVPVDLISVYFRDCWSKLGSITGDTVEEDIITEIFSKFCIGK